MEQEDLRSNLLRIQEKVPKPQVQKQQKPSINNNTRNSGATKSSKVLP